MGRRLRDSPLLAPSGESVIAPVRIDGLPGQIESLGRLWQRKLELHVTVLAAAVIDELGAAWEGVAGLTAGRRVGPISVTREICRVRHPDKPALQTIVVMAQCPALGPLYEELSAELDVRLSPPPAHVTLYSTDPEQGIGIDDEAQLRERAPELSHADQEEVRRAMRFDRVFSGES